MSQTFPARVWREGGRFLARCLPVGVVSEGASREEALERLRRGMALYLEGPLPTLEVVGWRQGDGPWCPSSVSSRQALEKLKGAGYHPVAEGNGHIKLVKTAEGAEAEARTVLLPYLGPTEELAIGTLNAILEQAGLARGEFNALAPVEETSDVR